MMNRIRSMAHPATVRTLTVYETHVLAAALAYYQRECMAESRAMRSPSLYAASVRREAMETWANRASVAKGLYDSILSPEHTARVTVRS